jgi:hypothetical protein
MIISSILFIQFNKNMQMQLQITVLRWTDPSVRASAVPRHLTASGTLEQQVAAASNNSGSKMSSSAATATTSSQSPTTAAAAAGVPSSGCGSTKPLDPRSRSSSTVAFHGIVEDPRSMASSASRSSSSTKGGSRGGEQDKDFRMEDATTTDGDGGGDDATKGGSIICKVQLNCIFVIS